VTLLTMEGQPVAHGRGEWSAVVPFPCVAAELAVDPGPPYTTRPAHPGDAVVTRSPIKEKTR
jgi:hypothetical protein